MGISIRNRIVTFPMVTTAQRLALSVYEGTIVYDTQEHHYYYWDSVQWVEY